MPGNLPRSPLNRESRHPSLDQTELHQLTLFKWRYTLESLGFSPSEVQDLLFLTWLRATARVHG